MRVNLKLTDGARELGGQDGGRIRARGFDLEYPDGHRLFPSNDGPVADHLYYFNIAGVGHHQSDARSNALSSGSRVFLVRERTNEFDSRAVHVISEDKWSPGYVPDKVAVSLSALMDRLRISVVPAVVTKMLEASGKRVAIEVLCGVDIDVSLVGDNESYEVPGNAVVAIESQREGFESLRLGTSGHGLHRRI